MTTTSARCKVVVAPALVSLVAQRVEQRLRLVVLREPVRCGCALELAGRRIQQRAPFHLGATVNKQMMAAGVALLLVGLAFKVAAVPFHMWSPDVYQGAPTPISAFMATGVKAASFAAIGRVLFSALVLGHGEWVDAMVWLAGLTILVGNIAALVQATSSGCWRTARSVTRAIS